MCTAVSYRTKQHYFGRNLDLERSYGEGVVVTPRRYPFPFSDQHYGMIGMAAITDGYPLYFEATNEKGLSMAGLNFPGNAVYYPHDPEKENVAPYELIPYMLGRCENVQEACEKLKTVNVEQRSFSDALPVSPLHWMIADRERDLVLECTKEGMKIHENPCGVLTNNPTFDYHLMNVQNYRGLHEGALTENDYSLGMGAIGLPGDFSSVSRFVRAVFVREHSVCDGTETQSVNQFFHILESVAMPRGCVRTPDGQFEYTRYSCCCNTDTQVYYYTTYDHASIRHADLRQTDLNSANLCYIPLV